MKNDAKEGLSKVMWATILTVGVMSALAALLWWYDEYVVHHL